VSNHFFRNYFNSKLYAGAKRFIKSAYFRESTKIFILFYFTVIQQCIDGGATYVNFEVDKTKSQIKVFK